MQSFCISGALVHFLRRQKHHLKDKTSQLLDICNQVCVWCDLLSYEPSVISRTLMLIRTLTYQFIGHFGGKLGLASCPVNFLALIVPNLCILLEQTKAFHILLEIIPTCLCWASPLSHALYLHHDTMFDPVSIIFMFSMSKPCKSTFPDHQSHWFQFQLVSEFFIVLSVCCLSFFLSFIIILNIHLMVCISILYLILRFCRSCLATIYWTTPCTSPMCSW